MNRRDFVAALVAAGAVCTGLNGCSKAKDGDTDAAPTSPEDVGSPQAAPTADGSTAPTTDSGTAPATDGGTAPIADGGTFATPTPSKDRRRHKPPSETPAGDGSTIP